jgi:proton glutamate symport protein
VHAENSGCIPEVLSGRAQLPRLRPAGIIRGRMTTSSVDRAPRGMSQSTQIFIGLAVGVIAGLAISRLDPASAAKIASWIKPFGQLFLRLIRMVVAPLIFSTLVAGVAGAGHFKVVGRMGLRAIIYFECVTTLALVIGLVTVNLLKPGVGIVLPAEAAQAVQAPQTWDQILLHAVPESVVDAMARGDILQVVVFAMIFAIALGAIGDKGRPVLQLCESISETMFRFTNIIMGYASIGVGAAIAYTIAVSGAGVLKNLAGLVGTLYVALAVFAGAVLLPVALLFGVPIRRFLAAVREPALIAFTTSTSEAALPRAMETMEAMGCPRRIVSFVLPLGYTFNLDGTTLYLSLAAMFVAQAAGVSLTIGQQITMMLTLMLTSKGVAGVPRASLVILAATLASYQLPLSGVTLILGVDAVMDMARTMVNVVGNCLATVVVSRWEGEFRDAGAPAQPRAI